MLKKQKIVGYLILILYLVLCLINDIHDCLRKKKAEKQDWDDIFTKTTLDPSVFTQQWAALLCSESSWARQILTDWAVAGDVLLRNLLTFRSEIRHLLVVMILIEFMIVPCVFWDVFLIGHVPLFGPYQMPGNIPRLSLLITFS